MQTHKLNIMTLVALAITLALGMYLGRNGLEELPLVNEAEAAVEKVNNPAGANKPAPPSPVQARPRDVYFPNSEEQRLHRSEKNSMGYPDASGYVVTTRTGTGSSGLQCREFQQEITVGGKKEEAYGTACLQEDGSWKINE